MSGLINLIKSLFSGIFGFLGGLLGSKKKGADSDTASGQPKPQKSSNGFYVELEDAKGANSSSAPSQSAEPTAASAPAAKGEKKSSKRAEKLAAAKAEAGTNNNSAEPAKAPQPAAVTKVLNLPQPTVTNFSTDYLLPASTNGRRRPGANMASYLDMARNVKASN